jgi:VWFA-related protein
MKLPMKGFWILPLLAGLCVAQELPSAPSAAKTAPPAQTAPAQPATQPQAVPVSAPAPADPKPTPAALSQPPKQAETAAKDEDEAPITTIKKQVDEVNVIFTVTDKHGHFIKGLKKEDFAIMDDHKPPLSTVDFRSETNLPLRVALLIDASNSIRDRFNFELDAAGEFLGQTIRTKVDKAVVYGFDSAPDPVVADWTDSTERMSKGLRMLRPGGGTALWDIIYMVSREKLAKLNEQYPVRRVIILISDGDDNQSRVTRQEAIEMAQRAEVIVYAISTNISGVVSRGDKYLQELAEATGGRVFFPMKLQDIADKFGEIQEELRSQYAVAYKPSDFLADGRYRSIDIAAVNDKKLKVRARKGYYAPKQ